MEKKTLDKINFDFRLDDVGASTKIYEKYSKIFFGNFGILKDRRLLGAWGPYKELNLNEYKYLIKLINLKKKKLAIAITAGWLNSENELTPFNLKFPEVAEYLKEADKKGLIRIINHGLSHCVVGMHMPKLFNLIGYFIGIL